MTHNNAISVSNFQLTCFYSNPHIQGILLQIFIASVTFKWLLSKHVGEERVRNLMFPDSLLSKTTKVIFRITFSWCLRTSHSAPCVLNQQEWCGVLLQVQVWCNHDILWTVRHSKVFQKTRSPGWVCGWDPTENNEWNMNVSS